MDASAVTLTLPVAMALAGTAVTAGIAGVLWIVREIRTAVAPVAEQVRGHEVRIVRLEARADHATRRSA
jgi:hypothetical protein